MAESPAKILSQYLDPGERLLWSGQPRAGLRLRGQDVFLIPFSLMWGGFAIFWEATVFFTKAPFFFRLWGIPFVCVGLYMIFGRFFFDAQSRARTYYGVTNERILIISGVFSQQTKSLPLATLSDISLSQRKDGSGTIAFGPALYGNSQFPTGSWPGSRRYSPPAFDLIERAREVYDIVRTAQRSPSGNA